MDECPLGMFRNWQAFIWLFEITCCLSPVCLHSCRGVCDVYLGRSCLEDCKFACVFAVFEIAMCMCFMLPLVSVFI